MLVTLLGPVRVNTAEGWQRGGPAKRSCVLASLALSPNTVLSMDTLRHRVWGPGAPDSAAGVIYSHITRIRKLFSGIDGVRLHRASTDGYQLSIDTAQVDALWARQCDRLARSASGSGHDALAARYWRQAAELWQGPALSDLTGDWADRTRKQLYQEQLARLSELYACELRRGRHAEVVAELAEAVVANPLAEGLVYQLMVGLYRCDRAAEALTWFTETRRRFIDTLGLEPSDRLRRLHQRILRQDPGLDPPADDPVVVAPVVPAQLPAAIGDFTGRADLLAELSTALPTTPVSIIEGMAGMGKTTLAVQAAHRVRHRFPDGQLFVDLYGHAPGMAPQRPVDALGRLLRGLGVPASDLPDSEAERAALFRSTVADRRLLVVLDNADSERQIRPLLPGSASCSTIITTRNSLGGLENARSWSMDALRPDEAVELFVRSSGRSADAGSDPNTVAALVELCGRLPLAVRILGARVQRRAGWRLPEVLRRLDSEHRRLSELTVGGRSVTAALELSYTAVGDRHRLVFRRLGVIPGAGFGAGAAAAVAGLPVDEVEPLLEDLVDAHLLIGPGIDRYRLHDLVRLFARQRGRSVDDPVERAAARSRLGAWYLGALQAAVTWFGPVNAIGSPVRPPESCDRADLPEFDGREAARSWWEQERPNLVAFVDTSDGPVTDLVELLAEQLLRDGDCRTAVEVAGQGLRCARRARDTAGQARMHCWWGSALMQSGDTDTAIGVLTEGMRLAAAASDRMAEVALLSRLGEAYYHKGRLRDAIGATRRCLAAKRDLGLDLAGVMNNLGVLHTEHGDLRQAADFLHRAVDLAAEQRPQLMHYLQGNLSEVTLRLGDSRTAESLVDEAIVGCRQWGVVSEEPRHLLRKAAVARARGERDEAVRLTTAAHDLVTEHGLTAVEAACLVSMAHSSIDEPEQAVRYAERAVGRAVELADSTEELAALVVLAEAALRTGDHLGLALTTARRAVDLARDREFMFWEGVATTVVAECLLASGDRDGARDRAVTALELHRATGHRPGALRVAGLLRAVDGTGRWDIATAG